MGVVDQNFTPAFRVGFADALSNCTSIQGSYMYLRSHGGDTVGAPDGVGGTVASLLASHPELKSREGVKLLYSEVLRLSYVDLDKAERLAECSRMLTEALGDPVAAQLTITFKQVSALEARPALVAILIDIETKWPMR